MVNRVVLTAAFVPCAIAAVGTATIGGSTLLTSNGL